MTPLGIGSDALWEGLIAGRSGVRRIGAWDPSGLEVQIAGEVPGFTAPEFLERRTARRMDRFSLLAVAAAGEAIERSGLSVTPENSERIAVVMNSSGGGISTLIDGDRTFRDRGPERVTPLLIPAFLPNMASGQVSMLFGIRGPSSTASGACASGVQAVVDAVRLLEAGEADAAVAGGADAGVLPSVIAGLGNLGALSKRNEPPDAASRPFDRARDGFVFAEGAAALVLEEESHALGRGAPILCRAYGGACTSDAYHLTAPEPSGDGAARSMRHTLARSGLPPTAFDYVAAHATSTQEGDASECRAIRAVFGDHARKLAISANKSMLGHTLAAAGAISAVACVLAIRDQVVPPTINLEQPDAEFDLDLVPNTARRMRVRAAMVNGFGFGGLNATAAFGEHWDGAPDVR